MGNIFCHFPKRSHKSLVSAVNKLYTDFTQPPLYPVIPVVYKLYIINVISVSASLHCLFFFYKMFWKLNGARGGVVVKANRQVAGSIPDGFIGTLQ